MASDGVQALDALQAHAVDLVVADDDMPNMDGLELLKQIKESYPRLPYILVTAYSNLRVIGGAVSLAPSIFSKSPSSSTV